MSGSWNDFNDARQVAHPIPKGTLAKVQLFFRPGGFDDPAQGWTGGYAARGASGAVYLECEFTVLEGAFARRKIFTLIGLYSPKGPEWGNMGRGLIRGILNSARGISNKDASPQAQAARRINGFADLNGIAFLAKIDIGKDANGGEKNEIRFAVTPDHKDYAALMGAVAPQPTLGSQPQAQPSPAQDARPAAGVRPSWAQ